MKKLLAFLLFSIVALECFSQACDYRQNRFGFRAEKNVFLGVDQNYLNQDDSLFIDIYYPVGSDELKRPLVLWAFGGGFFAGDRQSLSTLCEDMAKKGFVSVTIDYRIGFNAPAGVSPPFTSDEAEILRAGFRGIQDMKGAIRYMKGRHELDSIDIDRVWVGGFSAGGFVALGAAFVDSETEKPSSIGTIKPVNNINRLDMGSVEGKLHLNGYNSKVQGVFNFFGGLLDTNFIEPANNIALFSYHQTLDPVVPCDAKTPYWQLTFISFNYPIAYGSCVIDRRMKNLGVPNSISNAWIYTGSTHDVHNQLAVTTFMLENANPILCKLVSSDKMVSVENAKCKIYPNPATDVLHIESEIPIQSYSIFSGNGNLIQSGFNHIHSINISSLDVGLYIIQLKTSEGIVNKKWLKN